MGVLEEMDHLVDNVIFGVDKVLNPNVNILLNAMLNDFRDKPDEVSSRHQSLGFPIIRVSTVYDLKKILLYPEKSMFFFLLLVLKNPDIFRKKNPFFTLHFTSIKFTAK